jgi:hypothetical protein
MATFYETFSINWLNYNVGGVSKWYFPSALFANPFCTPLTFQDIRCVKYSSWCSNKQFWDDELSQILSSDINNF